MCTPTLAPRLFQVFLAAVIVTAGAYPLWPLHPVLEIVMVGAAILVVWSGTGLVFVYLEVLNSDDR